MLLHLSIYNSIAQFRLEHHLGEIVSIVRIHDPRAKWKIQYVIPPQILPLISDDNKLGIGKKFLDSSFSPHNMVMLPIANDMLYCSQEQNFILRMLVKDNTCIDYVAFYQSLCFWYDLCFYACAKLLKRSKVKQALEFFVVDVSDIKISSIVLVPKTSVKYQSSILGIIAEINTVLIHLEQFT